MDSDALKRFNGLGHRPKRSEQDHPMPMRRQAGRAIEYDPVGTASNVGCVVEDDNIHAKDLRGPFLRTRWKPMLRGKIE
jgi:hypothetical protein